MKFRKTKVDVAGGCSTVLELRKDTEALKQLAAIEEVVDVPLERGGVPFSDWEKKFVKDVRAHHDERLEFTPAQRTKIKEIWQTIDLRKRSRPDEQAQNLFSKLSPERQAEQRERAKKVRLPWDP